MCAQRPANGADCAVLCCVPHAGALADAVKWVFSSPSQRITRARRTDIRHSVIFSLPTFHSRFLILIFILLRRVSLSFSSSSVMRYFADTPKPPSDRMAPNAEKLADSSSQTGRLRRRMKRRSSDWRTFSSLLSAHEPSGARL